MTKFLLIIVIGIIMPQVNILPVNVSKNIELKDENPSFDSATSKNGFSKYIDLHLTKNKETESKSKIDSVESEASVAKNKSSLTESKIAAKKSGDLSENVDKNDETNASTLVHKVAASGNKDQIESSKLDQKALLESEKLMSFLTKADNTLINQSIENSSVPSPEQWAEEQKANYETQLLFNSRDLVANLSAVAKALGKEQAGDPLTPNLTEQTVITEELRLNNAEKVLGKKSASVQFPIDGDNKNNRQVEVPAALVKSVENNPVLSQLSELNTGSTTDVKIANVSTDKVTIDKISDDKTNTLQQIANKTLPSEALVDRNLVAKNNEGDSLNADQKVAIELAQISNIEKNSNGQPDNNETKPDAIKSLVNAVETVRQQINSTKPIQNEKVSIVSEPQLTNSELKVSSEVAPSNEGTKTNEKINQIASQLNKSALPNNQSATNDLIQDAANKTQVKQNEKVELSFALDEQSEQKQVGKNGDGVLVENKVFENDKRESSANRHFVDVSGRATQTPQEIIEQQSAETLNPSVATEVSQSQKTNAQLHQETISLFRKDFNEAVKDKVMLMISQKLQQFDITLDPPELGNMQVRVNLQGEQAVVSFLVQSQQTKDALEQNMHKLRELLAEQGVDVGDANVEQQSQQSANEEGSTSEYNNERESELDNMAEASDVISHTLSAQMIDSSTATVDYYA